MSDCIVPARRDVVVLVRSGDVIVSPAPSVVSRPGPSHSVVTRPKHTAVVSRSPGRVVESCNLRFVRSDPSVPGLPPSIEVVLTDDQWATIDSFPWESVGSMTWRVDITSAAGTEKVSSFVAASHNGGGVNPPDQVKWTRFGNIRFGDVPSQIDVVIVPSGAEPRLALKVLATVGVRVQVWRIQTLR